VVPGWNHGQRSPWKKAVAKAQALWNIQNRSSVTANQIKAAINRKLKTPVKTR
jgi:LysM repeat protein